MPAILETLRVDRSHVCANEQKAEPEPIVSPVTGFRLFATPNWLFAAASVNLLGRRRG